MFDDHYVIYNTCPYGPVTLANIEIHTDDYYEAEQWYSVLYLYYRPLVEKMMDFDNPSDGSKCAKFVFGGREYKIGYYVANGEPV